MASGSTSSWLLLRDSTCRLINASRLAGNAAIRFCLYTQGSSCYFTKHSQHTNTGLNSDGMVVTESRCKRWLQATSPFGARDSRLRTEYGAETVSHNLTAYSVAYLIHRVFNSDNSSSPLGNSVSSLLSIAWDVQQTTHCEIRLIGAPFHSLTLSTG
jgi:hypothetical protein